MPGYTREYGPVAFCVLVVIGALLADGCGGRMRTDDSPKDRARRGLAISVEVANFADSAIAQAYDSGLCEDQRKACSAATDAAVSLRQSIQVAEGQIAGWTGEDDTLACVVDSLAHLAIALQNIDGISVPDEVEMAFDLLAPFDDNCFTSGEMQQ